MIEGRGQGGIMKIKRALILLLPVVLLMGSTTYGQGGAFNVSGRIVVYKRDQSNAQTQQTAQRQMNVSLFTVKLHSPKEKGKPVLVAYPDAAGNFSFTNLARDSYLLEVYLGVQLLYQKILNLESNISMAVPVGDVRLVTSVNVPQRTSQALGGDFQGRVTVKVETIYKTTGLTRRPFSLSIYQGTRRLFSGTLTPPMLVAGFSYNNQRYILAGMLRTASGTDVVECEVYR